MIPPKGIRIIYTLSYVPNKDNYTRNTYTTFDCLILVKVTKLLL